MHSCSFMYIVYIATHARICLLYCKQYNHVQVYINMYIMLTHTLVKHLSYKLMQSGLSIQHTWSKNEEQRHEYFHYTCQLFTAVFFFKKNVLLKYKYILVFVCITMHVCNILLTYSCLSQRVDRFQCAQSPHKRKRLVHVSQLHKHFEEVRLDDGEVAVT
jgi:hypothetical protein